MKISVNQIQIKRPESNPEKSRINLDVDWNIDFKEDTNSSMKYYCFIKTSSEYPINFKINGIIGSENSDEIKKIKSKKFEELSSIISRLILDKGMEIMLNMINITKSDKLTLKTENENPKNSNIKINQCKRNFTDIHPCLEL